MLKINALVTYDVDNILEELLTARSDHHKIKRKIYTEIATNGEMYEVTPEDKKLDRVGGTSELKTVYMNALGLVTR